MNTRDDLTKQEKVVLAFIARGWRTAQIADELFISSRTVETHIAHIFGKLGVSSRTEAAIYALRANLTADAEMRKNPEDSLDDTSYAYGHEFHERRDTLIRERLA